MRKKVAFAAMLAQVIVLLVVSGCGNSRESKWEDLISESRSNSSNGELQEAVKDAEQALDYAKTWFGEGNYRVAASLNELGNAFERMGSYVKAESCYVSSLEVEDIRIEPKRFAVGRSKTLWNLGHVYRKTGRCDLALTFLQEGLALQEEIGGPSDNGVASYYAELAICYQVLGSDSLAESSFQHAYSISRTSLSRNNVNRALDALNYASFLSKKGSYRRAELVFREALADARESMSHSPERSFRFYEALAHCYDRQQRYDDAIPYLDTAISLADKAFGANDTSTLNLVLAKAGLF
jgi:tetratricopeptide (TPR) repeat protein